MLALGGNTSGTATITAPAVAGTVSNAVALSNSLTVGGPQVTVSAAGAGNGVLALSGNTSGTSTFTANATAGTFANPVAASNALSFPSTASTQPMICNATNTNDGFGITGGRFLTFVRNGSCIAAFDNTVARFAAASVSTIGWANGDPSSTSAYLGLSPMAANTAILAVGTGAGSSTAGLIQSGMTVFVTSNFTTSGVGTALEAITGLSITVPAAAANWKFHAHLSYSQAVGNAAVAFGIQAVTNAPTNIFANGLQQITVGPPATFTTGTLATLSTTTATTIVTGTPTATATNYIAELSGTCELGASANTIRLLVSTGTAADLVTVLRGSYFSFCP